MADDRVRLPSSTAGLTQFYDVKTTSFIIQPGTVVIIGVVIAVVVLLLHVLGGGFL